MTLRLPTTLALAASLMLLLTPTASADDHDSGGAVPAIPCQSEGDCPEDAECIEGTCVFEGDNDPGCAADTDCAEDEICLWGGCTDADGWCKSDEDCGEYLVCKKSNAPTAADAPPSTEPAPPPEGGPDGDTDSDGPDEPAGDSTDEPGDDPTDEDPGGDAVPTENEWGRCVVDGDSLPESDDCAAFCALAIECGEVGSGSSSSGEPVEPDKAPPQPDPADGEDDGGDGDSSSGDSEPPGDPPGDEEDGGGDGEDDDGWSDGPSEQELAEAELMCSLMCNYTAAVDIATEEFEAVLACVDGLTGDNLCSDLEDVCEAEGEAWVDAMEESGALEAVLGSAGVGLGASEDSASGGNATGAPQDPSPQGDGDEATQDGSTSGGATDSGGSGGEAGGADQDLSAGDDGDGDGSGGDSGGCQGGGGPAIPLPALLAIAALLGLRRRQQA